MASPVSAPDPHRFQLGAGALCLDFANTWGDRTRPESDRLTAPGELFAFARQVASTPHARLSRLARATRGARAEELLRSARELREAIHTLFATRAAGGRPPPAALARLAALLRSTLPARELRVDRREVAWCWQDDAGATAAVLGPIALSAAELLVSDDVARVRECDSPTCSWLFLDGSRAGTRRWCSMASCGNRAKARRHYRRRAGRAGERA